MPQQAADTMEGGHDWDRRQAEGMHACHTALVRNSHIRVLVRGIWDRIELVDAY